MEKIWHHIFYNEFKFTPEDHPIFLIDSCFSPHSMREKMTQIIFEVFNTPATHIANQALLAFYASGRGCGLVLNSGEGVTLVTPVYQGDFFFLFFKYFGIFFFFKRIYYCQSGEKI